MASGKPLDMQREERWPSQTEVNPMGKTGVKVVRKPWEVDSDYDDLEGVFGEYRGEPDPPSDEVEDVVHENSEQIQAPRTTS